MKQSNTALLIDELGRPLIRYLSSRVGNHEDANDLAQEAFLRMHKFQQSSKLDNARAFLFRTANNLVVDQQRRKRVHDRFLTSELLPEQSDEENTQCEPSAERAASAEQELDRLYAAVDRLPVNVRRAFLLHRSQDMSYPQIAREMGVSTSMVEKYIVRALKALRQETCQET